MMANKTGSLLIKFLNSDLTLLCMFIIIFLLYPSPMVSFLFCFCGLLCASPSPAFFFFILGWVFFFGQTWFPSGSYKDFYQDGGGQNGVEVQGCPSWTELMMEQPVQWCISCSTFWSPAPTFSHFIKLTAQFFDFSELMINLSSTWIISLWLLLAIEYSVIVGLEQPLRTVPFGSVSLLICLILITLPCWQ